MRPPGALRAWLLGCALCSLCSIGAAQDNQPQSPGFENSASAAAENQPQSPSLEDSAPTAPEPILPQNPSLEDSAPTAPEPILPQSPSLEDSAPTAPEPILPQSPSLEGSAPAATEQTQPQSPSLEGSASSATGENQLKNPGLEDFASAAADTSWGSFGGSGWNVTSAIFHTGAQSMDVFCSSAAAGSGASQIVYLYQNDTSSITYGGYAYQEGTSDAQARVQLSVVYNDSATDVAFFTPVVSSNWTLVNGTFNPVKPVQMATLYLLYSGETCGSRLFYDDLFVLAAANPAPVTANESSPPPLTSAASNPTATFGALQLVPVIISVNAKANDTMSTAVVSLGVNTPYEIREICFDANNPSLMSSAAGTTGTCILNGPACATGCVPFSNCTMSENQAGWCWRTLTIAVTRCATCDFSATISLDKISVGCGEQYAADCPLAPSNVTSSSVTLSLQGGSVGTTSSFTADDITSVDWFVPLRGKARSPSTVDGQASFLWGDPAYFLLKLVGVEVQAVEIMSLKTKITNNTYASVNNTGYIDSAYLANNGMGWDVSTQTLLFAYPLDKGFVEGLDEPPADGKELVSVRVLVQARYDSAAIAQRRRRSVAFDSDQGHVADVELNILAREDTSPSLSHWIGGLVGVSVGVTAILVIFLAWQRRRRQRAYDRGPRLLDPDSSASF